MMLLYPLCNVSMDMMHVPYLYKHCACMFVRSNSVYSTRHQVVAFVCTYPTYTTAPNLAHISAPALTES